MKNMDKPNEFFKEIFGSAIKQIEYPFHPADETLKAFIAGNLKSNQIFSAARLNQFRRGKLTEWNRTEVSAHVITCKRCSVLVREFSNKSVPKTSRSWWQGLIRILSFEPMRRSLRPVPTFARLIMIAQLALILTLSGAIYLNSQTLTEPVIATSEGTPPERTKTQQTQEKTNHPEINLMKTDMKINPEPDNPMTPAESIALKNPDNSPVVSATQSVAAGMTATKTVTPEVAQLALALKSEDPHQQIFAAQQLAALGNSSAVPPLVEAYSNTSNTQVHKVIINALREIWEETQNDYLQAAESLMSFKKTAENKQSEPDLHQGLFSDFSLRISFGQDETHYPIHFKVRFHQDVTLREINAMSRAVGGLFILDENTPDEAILKLPEKSEEDLKKIIQELRQNAKVKFIERQK